MAPPAVEHHPQQELDVLELEDRIQTQVQQEVDKTARVLPASRCAIQTELGEEDENLRELGDLRQ